MFVFCRNDLSSNNPEDIDVANTLVLLKKNNEINNNYLNIFQDNNNNNPKTLNKNEQLKKTKKNNHLKKKKPEIKFFETQIDNENGAYGKVDVVYDNEASIIGVVEVECKPPIDDDEVEDNKSTLSTEEAYIEKLNILKDKLRLHTKYIQ